MFFKISGWVEVIAWFALWLQSGQDSLKLLLLLQSMFVSLKRHWKCSKRYLSFD